MKHLHNSHEICKKIKKKEVTFVLYYNTKYTLL